MSGSADPGRGGEPIAGRDIVCIGASAGGVQLLSDIVQALPADYPGSIFVVLHVPPDNPSVLARVLDRKSALRAVHPEDGQAIEPGTVYVAPPDHHLLVKRGVVRVTRGPKENGFRPAVDPLFRTAAVAYGPRTVGVVLSGNLDDGTVGLAVIKRRGGVAIAQDPGDAIYPGMPRSAVERVAVDYVLPARDVPELLVRLSAEPSASEGTPVMMDDDDVQLEADIAELDADSMPKIPPPGRPSGYGCPDCGGALFALSNGDVVHFRCRVGHASSTDALMNRQGEALDAALWTALRALEENVTLSLSVAERLRGRGSDTAAKRFEAQAQVALRNAETIRAVLAQERGSVSRDRPAALLHADSAPHDRGAGRGERP